MTIIIIVGFSLLAINIVWNVVNTMDNEKSESTIRELSDYIWEHMANKNDVQSGFLKVEHDVKFLCDRVDYLSGVKEKILAKKKAK